ncbi:MAG: RES family NAD+ phosphorylase [Gammaproteobacteria bacterium]|nr:RES family NAD+ phosphorylase [Gammaproteobacteria bacterium]
MQLDFITQVVNFDKEVVRNTPILKPLIDEFDDLADDSFDRKFAHRFIQDKNHYSIEAIQYHAIDYVFSQAQLPPSRFSDGSFPAWYGSLDQVTTYYETCYHWVHDVLRDINYHSEKNIYQERSLFNVNCASMLLDLRMNKNAVPELVGKHPDAYSTTQLIAKKLHQQGNPGLYTSSARNENGENIVVYNKNILSHAEMIHDVIYEYNPEKADIIVRELKSDRVIIEI